jgi:hypothetical protein
MYSKMNPHHATPFSFGSIKSVRIWMMKLEQNQMKYLQHIICMHKYQQKERQHTETGIQMQGYIILYHIMLSYWNSKQARHG